MPAPSVDLPVRPFNAPRVPKSDEILKHPSLDALKKELQIGIKDVPFVHIDPGVFNTELVKLKMFAKPNPVHLENPPVLGGGNITEGTYSGTQAALTHAYSRIARSYESYFDVMQIEPTLPRYTDLSAKKDIFQYSAYPKNADGTVAQYPPHLQHIPKEDQVSLLKIFNALGLSETEILMKQVVPDSILGKTATWLLDVVNGNVSDAANQGSSIKAYETYNKLHRKSGTDIEQGANLGLLPDWYGDRRFADQSFTGTNPTTIEKIDKDLLDEFIGEAKQGGYDGWAKTLAEADPSSFFVQDCRYFRKAIGAQPNEELHHKEPSSDDSWACAAVTLFQLHPDGQLHPVAIVCDYKSNMANSVVIFNQRKSPSDSTDKEESDWPWRYAKTCAQVSDWIRHEIGIHLTRAHMIEESVIVATHRTIPMNHIVYKLLEPHWYKTLSLNAAARSTLVPQIIKDLVGLKPDYLYQFIRYEFEKFDFVQSYIPNDLKRRGFPNTAQGLSDNKYKNYAYAKNMVSMWSCIRKYVMMMLLTTYKSDKMVQDDQYIKDWSKNVQTDGFIKTFPTIQTLDQLCDAITMSIHIAAPFHTAVNYLQNFYQAFVLAKPPCLCNRMPASIKDLKGYTEKNLVDALPIGRQRQWLLSVQVPWLLSFKVPSDHSLITFAQSQWRAHCGHEKGDEEIRAISERFYNELKKLEVEFLATSKAMSDGSIPYMVMDPANTATATTATSQSGAREEHIVTHGSTKDGSFTTWILTDPTSTAVPSSPPSKHTTREPSSATQTAYGIASVFTLDEFRRRGLARENFTPNYLLVKGSDCPRRHVHTPVGAPDSRVWMLWSCVWHGGTETPPDNVVDILHHAVENDGISDDDLSKALGAVVGVAHANAQDWLCAKIDMCNSDGRTQVLLADITNFQGELVVRQTKKSFHTLDGLVKVRCLRLSGLTSREIQFWHGKCIDRQT